MTRVDYYLLAAGGEDAVARAACRIVDKAFRAGHRVWLCAPDMAVAQTLDTLLWTFSANAFIPHALAGQATDPVSLPVLIGTGDAPESHREVVVNLSTEIPRNLARHLRIAEVVGGDETVKSAARERFRHYRDAGADLHTHAL